MEENREQSVQPEIIDATPTDVVPADMTTAVATEVGEARLSTKLDTEKLEKIRQSIDLDRIELFGSDVQNATNQLSEQVLKNVKRGDIGQVGDVLKDAALKIKKLESQNEPVSKIPFFNFFKEKKDEALVEIQSVAKQLSDIESTLEKNIEILYRDTEMFNQLYELNEQKFAELEHHIQAGEEYLHEAKVKTLTKMELDAEMSGDAMAIQQVKDYQAKLNRLDKKLTDLKVTRHLCLQTAPQIRLIQGNNVLLVQNIQTTINTILPVVRSNVTVTAGLNRQKEILELNNAVSELANNVLLENSRLMKDNVIETVRQSEAPIVKIETLREVNQNILTTLDMAIKVQQEGIAKRKAVNDELVKLEHDLVSKISEYKN